MKKLFILFGLTFMFSCGDFFNNEQHKVTYVFVNEQNVSDVDKKMTPEVLKKRLSRFTNQVDAQLNSKNEIIIKLSGDVDIEHLNTIVENRGKLDFWPCVTKEQMVSFILDVDRINVKDSIPKPFSSLVKGMSYDGLPIFSIQDTLLVRQLLNGNKIKELYIEDYRGFKFLFGVPTDEMVNLYGVRSNDKVRALVNETHIVEVRQDYDQINRPAISINMNEYGAHNWSKMTNEAYLNSTKIAIAINDIVYSAPTVSGGQISGGQSQISGDFTLEEAQNLSYILSSQSSIPKLKFANIKKIENQ